MVFFIYLNIFFIRCEGIKNIYIYLVCVIYVIIVVRIKYLYVCMIIFIECCNFWKYILKGNIICYKI